MDVFETDDWAPMQPQAPQPHFPSRYLRPTIAPTVATHVTMPDGARIATFVYGSLANECVCMIHGNGEEHGIFGPIIDRLVEAGYCVVTLDSRAQGKSTRGTARLTYELMAKDAVCVLDALKVASFHLLGFSDGGIEVLIIARDWPERTLSATALGANLTPEGVIEAPEWDLAGEEVKMRAWAEYWTDPGTSCEMRPEDVDRTLLLPSPGEAYLTAELFRLMLDEPQIEASSLASITCPVTVCVGEMDCICPYETAQIARNIPNVRLKVINDAYHSLPKHEVDFVTRLLLETMASA